MSPKDDPWFVSVLDGGSVAAPYGPHPEVSLTVVEHGDIDIISGRLRVALPHDFRTYPPLDAPISNGQLRVSSIVDDGDRTLLLRVHRPQSRCVRWCRALADGRPASIRSASVLIGDADLEATLGQGPTARAYPRRAVGSVFEQRRPQPTGDETLLLLPTSSVRSYHSGSRHPPYPDRRLQRGAPPEAWIGFDEHGEAAEVVIDHLAVWKGKPYELIDDPWRLEVAEPGGQVCSEASTLQLVEEPGDIGQAFTEAFAEEFGAILMHLGAVALKGQIVAFDPKMRYNPLRLPVVAKTDNCPSFAYFTDFADLLLIRLGNPRPVTWFEVMEEDDAVFIPIDTGTYVIADLEVLAKAESDEQTAEDLAGLHDVGLDVAVLESEPGHGAVVNSAIGGDVPAWCYLGLSADDTVTAVVVALVTDPIYGSRPESHDRAVLDETSRLLRNADEETREDASIELQSIRARAESVSKLSYYDRASLYNLRDRLLRGGW